MSNNKQQLVTEWLQEGLDVILTHEQQMQCIGLFEQAKDMEEQQAKYWFKLGMSLVEGHLWKPSDKFQEYYTKKYGDNE